MSRPDRIIDGPYYQFDSVSLLLGFCRERHATTRVRTLEVDDEFVLHVQPAEGAPFESLIVHFEGERTYAVMLPAIAGDDPPNPSRIAPRVVAGEHALGWSRAQPPADPAAETAEHPIIEISEHDGSESERQPDR